jgi:hypothetical protein
VWLWLWRWLGGSKVEADFFQNKNLFFGRPRVPGCGWRTGGSGLMGVVSLDRGDQGGSNGGNFELWLWLWRWLAGSKVGADFFCEILFYF